MKKSQSKPSRSVPLSELPLESRLDWLASCIDRATADSLREWAREAEKLRNQRDDMLDCLIAMDAERTEREGADWLRNPLYTKVREVTAGQIATT